jgi:hypothetical protein
MVARKTTAWLHDGRREYVFELTGQNAQSRDRLLLRLKGEMN